MDEEEVAPVAATSKRSYRLIKEKLDLCLQSEIVVNQEKQLSFRQFCHNHSVAPSNLHAWKRNIKMLKEAVMSKKSSNKTLNKGNPTSLHHIKDVIMEWINRKREKGMALSTRMVILQVSRMDPTFRDKKIRSKYSIVQRFLRTNKVSIRRKTHEAQKHPQETQDLAEKFIVSMRPFLLQSNQDKRFIINMDQTPIFFSMVPNTTLNRVGERSVNVRSSSSSTMRVTVALTVTAAGGLLPPMFVFKAKPGGHVQRELRNFPEGAAYTVQHNTWMDESVMLQWVDRVLKPWSETVPETIVPYLLLDSYKVHLMTTVTRQIESLGIEVDHIPGGCTGLAQPIDVRIGKPFKNRVRHKWEDWIMDGAIDEEVTKPPTCLQVVEWCCNSFRELEGTIVCNAWLNGRFSYFPVTSEETIDVDDCEDDEEPEYIDVAPQDGDVYHLVVDNDVNIDYNDVVEAEEV